MKPLSADSLRLLRMRSQRLLPGAASGVPDVVETLVGAQAQELGAATLAIRPRSAGLTAEDVRRAREEDRSIVLTWCQRGTLHLAATRDLEWLLALFGPLFIRKGERRFRQLGLDAKTRARAARTIRGELSRRGPLVRAELAKALAAKGIPVEGQAIAHLVRYAALAGEICFGPRRDGKMTYVLLEDWIGSTDHREVQDPLAELARRYLDGYGPAAPADLASWSGLSMKQARAGFEAISGELLEVVAGGVSMWLPKGRAGWLDEPSGEGIVRLIPGYDAYLLGYASRELIASPEAESRIHPGGGRIKPTLIVGGRATGLWRMERKKSRVVIAVEPFEPIGADALAGVKVEVKDVGRFLGKETELRVEPAKEV